jgi:hypothetical protein
MEATMDIDRQRIAAVSALEALGFSYHNGTWLPAIPAPSQALPLIAEADAMHAALVRRADALANCTEDLKEASELAAITNIIEAYEDMRWPDGKEPGGRARYGAKDLGGRRSRGAQRPLPSDR